MSLMQSIASWRQSVAIIMIINGNIGTGLILSKWRARAQRAAAVVDCQYWQGASQIPMLR
jgi:hypothetical protein